MRPYGRVWATLDKDGCLELKMPYQFQGPQTEAMWKSVAAEILGLDIAAVKVSPVYDEVPPAPSCLSVNVAIITGLVERVCTQIKNKRFRQSLPITVHSAYKPSFAEENGFPGRSFDRFVYSRPALAAAVVEVEIDQIDFTPKIRGVWLAAHSGRVQFPNEVESVLRLSILQAIGWSFYENINGPDGRITKRPEDFLLYSTDPPPIHIDVDRGEGKASGYQELPFDTVPAAFSQAVSQAMNHQFDRLPVSPIDLWRVWEKTQ
jgi:CO/xanthine dehydrogenase Mo-binding subunit